ncbi:MAG: Hsp20/alpha crystallin family protein [Verrucomicrobiota bacterium]
MSKEITKREGCDVPAAKCGSASTVKPYYTVKQGEDAFELGVVMPGVAKGDVRVSVEDDVLTVAGVRGVSVPEGWRPLHSELSRSDYELELRLNVDVDEDGISAKLEDGILSLRLPLSEAAKPREIEVS